LFPVFFPLDGAFLAFYSTFSNSDITLFDFRSSKSIHSPVIEFTQARANYSSEATAKYDEQATYCPATYAHPLSRSSASPAQKMHLFSSNAKIPERSPGR
jgi:hypothetical protein